jgi:hypothetical protein
MRERYRPARDGGSSAGTAGSLDVRHTVVHVPSDLRDPAAGQASDLPRQGLPGTPWNVAAVLVGVLTAATFLTEAIFLLRARARVLMTTTPDDSFYYLEIARRAAAGEGFTFDGINSTSGYHPLWQWMLIPLAWMFPGEETYVRAVRLIALALVAIAFALVARVIWRSGGPLPAMVGVLLASRNLEFLRSLDSGMETPVVLLALALLLSALVWFFEAPNPRRAAVVGLTCALLVLTRLDMAVVVPVVGLSMLWRTRRWSWAGWWIAGAAALSLPFAVHHITTHGLRLTTSATVKRYWVDDLMTDLGGRFSGGHLTYVGDVVNRYVRTLGDQVSTNLLPTPLNGLVTIAVIGLTCLGAAASIRHIRRERIGLSPTGAAATTVGVLIAGKALLDIYTVPQWALSWYSAPARVAVSFAVGVAAVHGAKILVRNGATRWILLPMIAAMVLLPLGTRNAISGRATTLAWQLQVDRAAEWIIDKGPSGRYGAFDAGLLGYRLESTVDLVNLDGLVNDNEFADYLESRPSRPEVIRREGIDVLANVLEVDVRETDWACAETLWVGDRSVRSTANTDGPDRMYVLDVRGC